MGLSVRSMVAVLCLSAAGLGAGACARRATTPAAEAAAAAASAAAPSPGGGHAGHGAPSAAAGDAVPLFDDLGTHHHPVTTRVPEAQRYFDQGLRLVYAFNHDEAHRAFVEAVTLDPECTMAYWGMALALGPNINLPRDDERERMAWEAITSGRAQMAHATPRERAYVEALALRYAPDPETDRAARQRAYADAMRALAARYPDDLDAATLAAEAMMDLRPWDLWTPAGEPQPGTLEIVEILEGVLRRSPDHPGANHYYIHAVEASPQPERALASAGRMGRLMPGAGHIVHMPSHVYMRVGRYADAAEVNRRAIAADERYFERGEPSEIYRSMYASHNVHFLWSAASMAGRSAEAIRAARDVSAAVTPDLARGMPMLQYFQPTYVFALARFGRWETILGIPSPPPDLGYEVGMWHYARGLAFVGTGRPREAAREQAALVRIAQATPPDLVVGLNSAQALLTLAAEVLAGEIAAARGDVAAAERLWRTAITVEDGLRYDEPQPWYQPVRQLLGALLLAERRPADAEIVFREDLVRNPENGWSLYGLAASQEAQGKVDDAAATRARFAEAWAGADVTLTRSRF